MSAKPQGEGNRLDPVHDRLCGLAYLIVGESRFARATIKSTLNGFGFRDLTECEQTEHALKIVQGSRIDVIVTEYDMPGSGGPEFIRRLRHLTDDRVRRLPVVMVGNDAVASHVQAAVNAGVNEFLPRPYSRRDLYFRIRRAVVSPKTFVVVADYAGPDRRSADVGLPAGGDRRKRQAMSVQLYAIAGSEPKWVKAAKFDSIGVNDPLKPRDKTAPAPPVHAAADAQPKPSFSALSEAEAPRPRPPQRKE